METQLNLSSNGGTEGQKSFLVLWCTLAPSNQPLYPYLFFLLPSVVATLLPSASLRVHKVTICGFCLQCLLILLHITLSSSFHAGADGSILCFLKSAWIALMRACMHVYMYLCVIYIWYIWIYVTHTHTHITLCPSINQLLILALLNAEVFLQPAIFPHPLFYSFSGFDHVILLEPQYIHTYGLGVGLKSKPLILWCHRCWRPFVPEVWVLP